MAVLILPSISLYVVWETESETQALWNDLIKGGFAMMELAAYDWSKKYGWLQDKFGISWQIAFGTPGPGKIRSHLRFYSQASNLAELKAVSFYTSIFDNSSVNHIVRYEPAEGGLEGTVKHAQFSLNDFELMAMDSSAPHGLFSTKRFHSWYHVIPRKRLTIIGTNLPKTEKKAGVDGLMINLACRGKSYPPYWVNRWATPPVQNG